ncbi:MAG: hypothetical protein BWY26_00640 [Elusimicrobia bacterium ADurb.Bin231]|nr:MAG: hypothetical protein BWY26_00640 [Elusimicrobia bacterium ADurb.Bin231]
MNIIYYLDLIGTFIFAVSGALSAANKRFDIFGALFVGFITAVGGGTIRDLLLDMPVFWIYDLNYLIVIILAVIITFMFSMKILRLGHLLLLFDAVGIGVFTLIGIQKSVELDILPVICVLLGVTTAVMGGIFRDVFCNEIPLILQREIYATACLSGGIIYFTLEYWGVPMNLVYIITILTIIGIRLAAIWMKLSLPKINVGNR